MALLPFMAAAMCLPARHAAAASLLQSDTTVLDRVIVITLRDATLRDALDTVARAAQLRLSYSPDLLPLDRRVTLVHARITAGTALRALLSGTDTDVILSPNGLVVLAPRVRRMVHGRVVDAVTGAPVSGVSIDVEGGAGTTTARDGTFVLHVRDDALPRLVLRRMGYRTATVRAVGGTAVNVALAPAALTLDRLDVVGPRTSVAEAERAHAVTILRPAELAAVQPRTLGEVFRAAAAMLAPADGSPSPRLRVTGIRGATSLALSPPKVYLDGVELGQPQYAGVIDPAMIERIEIVRGPQGAALYGSDAIGGVVHIVTRKAAPGAETRLGGEVRAATGWMQPALGGGSAWTADQFIAGTYAGRRTAATVGASLMRQGSAEDWGGRRMGAFAGMRATAARAAAEVSIHTAEQTWRPTVNDVLRANDLPMVQPELDEPQRVRLVTAGTTLRLLARANWSHTLTVGHDHSVLNVAAERAPQISPPDSTLGSARGVTDRSSLRYTSMLRVQLHDASALFVTTGGDLARLYHDAVTQARDARPPGRSTEHRTTGTRRDAGAFARLELTLPGLLIDAGLRAEHSSTFGVDHGPAWLPAAAAAYSTAAGPLVMRWRGAWGRAIRPAWPTSLNGHPRLSVVTDPALAPEAQTGMEMGVDIDVGGRATLRLTRFDQTVDGLIYSVMVDTLTAVRQNIGRIDNHGWETELTVHAGRVTLRGSHTTADSRVTRLTRAYAGELRPGDRVPEVPASATSLTVGFDSEFSHVALSGLRVGSWESYDWISLYHDRTTDTQVQPARSYRITYPPLLRLDLAATVQVSSRFGALLKLGNLTGTRRGGRDNLEPAPGRTISVGMQMR
ncbi:MAG: TonB-dependent receptor domain-containing protein [Longimicrobiales bacterium]